MNSKLTLKTAYWDDPRARTAFKTFMQEIFGLDFREWESAGYWDEAYTPFSFFEEDRVVASVCIYLLDAVVDGRKTRLAQISGVGTLPPWRRQGLNRRLTEIGLDWAQDRHEGVFLFANEDAIPFYQRCGFEPLPEYVERVPAPTAAHRPGLQKLDCTKQLDRDMIYQYAQRRSPVSDRFAILNPKLVMFHALHRLREHAYEIPELECAVFFTREGGCLRLLDVVGERVPSLDELYPYLKNELDGVIEFHFFSDKLSVHAARLAPWLGDNCFVKAPFPLERPVFPFTGKA